MGEDKKEVKGGIVANVISQKPVWLLNNELADAKRQIQNKIVQSEAVEKMVCQAAEDGLKAERYDPFLKKWVPDHYARYKYWRDILIMKKWLSKTDVNIDMRSLTINAKEEEILKRYENQP